jgi:hypothetical protein
MKGGGGARGQRLVWQNRRTSQEFTRSVPEGVEKIEYDNYVGTGRKRKLHDSHNNEKQNAGM